MDEMKDETRAKAQDFEMQKKSLIETTEHRVEALYEERMLELTNLQAKLALYQGQLQDAHQVSSSTASPSSRSIFPLLRERESLRSVTNVLDCTACSLVTDLYLPICYHYLLNLLSLLSVSYGTQ
jgi:hypothetical protein